MRTLPLLLVLVTGHFFSAVNADCSSAAAACELQEQTILEGPIPSSPLSGVASKNYYRASIDVDLVHSSNNAYDLFEDSGKDLRRSAQLPPEPSPTHRTAIHLLPSPPPTIADRLYDYTLTLSSIYGRNTVLISVSGENGAFPTDISDADFHNEGGENGRGGGGG